MLYTRADARSAPYDFTPVLAALAEYTAARAPTCATPPVRVSGWEAEDPAIRPPAPLLRQLAEIPARPLGYACPHDFSVAKAEAAELLSSDLSLGGAALCPQQVTFTQNSTQALLLLWAALADTGIRRVVVAAPAYYAGIESARRLGLAVEVISARDYQTGALDVERLVAAARAPTRAAVLVTNPAYSVGVEYAGVELATLAHRLSSRVPLVLDETRLGLYWHEPRPWYAAAYPANTVVVRSPSKVFFANGQKLSLLLAAPPLIRAVERAGEALVGSLAGNTEATALAYLTAWRAWRLECARIGDDQAAPGPYLTWRAGVLARMRANLRHVAAALAPAGYALSPADSGPYVLAARPRDVAPPLDARRIARRHGVLLMDARYFLHESPIYTGFRVNLAADGAAMRAALARVLPGPRRRVLWPPDL